MSLFPSNKNPKGLDETCRWRFNTWASILGRTYLSLYICMCMSLCEKYHYKPFMATIKKQKPQAHPPITPTAKICWVRQTRERPPEGVVCFTGKLCRNAAHAKRSQVFFSQVAKKKNIHTEELSSVCNHQRTKIPPVTMCIIHRKNINFGCNLLQHTSVPKNILSVCNQQRTKISPPHPPPCHNVNHPPKNINFGCNLLQHTSVPKKIQSVCNPQRTKISPPHPPHPMPRQSTKHYYFSPTSSVVATNNERE